MNLDTVRNVKNEARGVVSQMLRNDVSRRKLGIRTQSIDNAVQPRSIALGAWQPRTAGTTSWRFEVSELWIDIANYNNAAAVLSKKKVEFDRLG